MYYDAKGGEEYSRVPQHPDIVDLDFEEVYTPKKDYKKEKMEKKKFKRLFKGKTKSEMESSFRMELRSKGVPIYLFEAFMNSRKRKTLSDISQKIIFIILAIIGFSLFCTLMAFAMDYHLAFPSIFSSKDINFFEKFVNVLFGISLFGISFIVTGYSINKLFKLF